ncbi:MAG TPA: galactose oxidase-like domain-containing protein, partial [Myxococcaceae bacterium]|nr:galactose oxidase-like domain-containing protein [Myxococcaceae bacterium]
VTNEWVQSQSMVDGRWYASATTLSDGRVMTFSGLSLTGGTNNSVEIYDLQNAGPGWSMAGTAPFSPPLYPRQFLLPNGKVFYSGHGSGTSSPTGWMFDPVAKSWTGSTATTRDRSYGSAVLLPLLPPTYTPRVMALGGGSPAASSTEIIDLSVASPAWSPGPAMSTGRIQMDAVLLPNGKVLALGGSVNNEAPDTPGKAADLLDPSSPTLSPAGVASYSRLYHSAALLLPDGRVMSIGSNPSNRGTYLSAIEIYTPAYLFDSSDRLITTGRPSITGISPASGTIGYGAPFSVTYTASSAIRSAVLVRPGSVTHAFDMEQRVIGLCGPSPQPACSVSGTLNLTSPPNGGVAPPGYYMLFLLDSAGVPSIARFVQLTPYGSPPPVGAIVSPGGDMTIAAGGSVSFGTSTPATKYSWVFPGGTPATSTAQNPGNVTFSTPGSYTASLTVVDASGNSDPSPPTRLVRVLPTTPNFDISVVPSGTLVNPGQSTNFTVTVTPLSGFNGPVSLSVASEAAFPAGVTSGGFSPSIINGSGTSTLTMNTTTSAAPYALSLTITGTSGSVSHTTSTTLMVALASPTSLSATPASGQVSLSWTAPVRASGYQIKRSTVSGGPYATVGCSVGTSTSFVDAGLTNGTTYFYVVSATYSGSPVSGGASADSSQVSATPQGAAAPQPPTGLGATAGNAQVSLSWTASSGATSYNVKRATTTGGPYTTVGSPTGTTFTNTGLTNGTTYFYVVTAVNASGESGSSSEVSATPQAVAPAPPTAVSASPNKPGRLSVRWTQSTTPGVTQNGIFRRTGTGAYPTSPTATIPANTQYQSDGLTKGTTYCYVVTAISGAVSSPASNESCGTPK